MKLSPRQIHLDFHTPAWAEDVAADFDANRFADTLAEAGVTSVTCFARCHHGLIYYPTGHRPDLVHPNLKVADLLNRQVAACHARGIRVPVYTTVQWDERQATDHPEWLCVGADGRPVGGRGPLAPGFYAFLDVFHPGYRAFLREHVADLLRRVPDLDGLFFDIVQPRWSLAPHWLAAMGAAGVDPADAAARERFGRAVVDEWKLEMSNHCRSLPEWTDDKTLFYNAGHVGPLDAAAGAATTHHEIESLPGGQWGYLHFPVAHAYARATPKPSLAMTGRFHTTWGDFHSYRQPAALEYECLRSIAEGAAAVSVGDQLYPSGELDAATYRLIGGVFRQLEELEPHFDGARPVREIAVLTPEAVGAVGKEAAAGALGAMGGEVGEADSGAIALLNALHRQVDRVTPDDDFGPYAAVVVPDRVACDDALTDKLARHLDGGGAVLLSGECGAARRLAGVTRGDGEARPLDFLEPARRLRAGAAADAVRRLRGGHAGRRGRRRRRGPGRVPAAAGRPDVRPLLRPPPRPRGRDGLPAGGRPPRPVRLLRPPGVRAVPPLRARLVPADRSGGARRPRAAADRGRRRPAGARCQARPSARRPVRPVAALLPDHPPLRRRPGARAAAGRHRGGRARAGRPRSDWRCP